MAPSSVVDPSSESEEEDLNVVVFDPPSDDEVSDIDEQRRNSGGHGTLEAPWDFSAFSTQVVREHERDGTTSLDYKIAKALKQRGSPFYAIQEESGSDKQPRDMEEGDADTNPAQKPSLPSSLRLRACLKNKPAIIQELYEEDSQDKDDDPVYKNKPFFASSEGVSFSAQSFWELELSYPLLKALGEKLGYRKPTPIQAACIPLAMMGRDLCGSAITGSGKTAAFALPTLEQLLRSTDHRCSIRVLVLTPTRELGLQDGFGRNTSVVGLFYHLRAGVLGMIQRLAQFTNITCCQAVGGLSVKEQEQTLSSLPDIVVATPGRMLDHLCNSMGVHLHDLQVLILDEADRLLENGFSSEIRELLKFCPRKRQTMLFSATMNTKVDELVKLSLNNPVRLSADPCAKRPAGLTEEVVRIRRMHEANREAVLLALCSKTFTDRVLIFSRTKVTAHRLTILFKLAGLNAAELHGNISQDQRLHALEVFKNREVEFLITTELISRGIDIPGIETVINYDCPSHVTSYVHRVGRTARAGRKGYAVTFVTEYDRPLLKAIANKIGSKLKSRIVAQRSIDKWSQIIEQMEDHVSTIIQEEKVEEAFKKADMEARKAANIILHEKDIFSRPKKVYTVTGRQKRMDMDAAKATMMSKRRFRDEVISAEQAEDLKLKRIKKQEHEKSLPRKKRRKLVAARGLLEE